MLRLLIRKEIAAIIRSSKFAITYGVAASLTLLAFLMGAANYKVGMEEYEASLAESKRLLEEVKRMPATGWWATGTRYAVRVRSPRT